MQGVYDVDIQEMRKRYFQRKRKLWFWLIAAPTYFALNLWLFFVSDSSYVRHSIHDSFGLYWSTGGIAFGFSLLLGAAVSILSYHHLFRRFFRFPCPNPSPHCKQWIDTWEEWKCSYCPAGQGINDGMKRSFFQKCKHCGRKPDAHQCPNCGFVFELIPGGNIYKYSKRPNVTKTPIYPAFPKPPEPEPEPVKVEEPPLIPHGIPAAEKFSHTLIVAETGWGKTWLLKTLSYHEIQARNAVIIVDSEGGYAEKTLYLRDKGDMIYIDFTDPVNVPCLSMFDVKLSSDPKERERIFSRMIDMYLYVFSSLMGATLTPSQKNMLKFLCALMMNIKGANLQTLKDVIFDHRPFQGEIRRYGGNLADYFAKDWHTKEIRDVKQQLMNRLNTVLSDPILARIFTQSESRIDLYKAMNQGKVIVVNVNRGHLGKEQCSILGRFFIGMLFQSALRREEGKQYRPAFLFVDEASRYFDDNLQEMYETARKRRLGLVIATQQISHFKDVSMSLRNAAFSSAIKFIGGITATEDAEAMKELGLDPKYYSANSANNNMVQIKEQVGGEEHLLASDFYCGIRGQRARKVRISYADVQHAPLITTEEYKEMLEENNKWYCQRVRERGARVQPEADETVYEQDADGVFRQKPRGLGVDREDDWAT